MPLFIGIEKAVAQEHLQRFSVGTKDGKTLLILLAPLSSKKCIKGCGMKFIAHDLVQGLFNFVVSVMNGYQAVINSIFAIFHDSFDVFFNSRIQQAHHLVAMCVRLLKFCQQSLIVGYRVSQLLVTLQLVGHEAIGCPLILQQELQELEESFDRDVLSIDPPYADILFRAIVECGDEFILVEFVPVRAIIS